MNDSMKTLPIASFEKVSFDEYRKSRAQSIMAYDEPGNEAVSSILLQEWEQIKLPTRQTSGAAGYDFYVPYDVTIYDHARPVTIPTGVCAAMVPGWVLMIFPRSGLGFKNGFRLSNSVGIIDEDYYHADNEGHIKIRCYAADKTVELKAGDRFAQGIFLPYGIACNGNLDNERTGGFGSTGV